MKKYYIDLGSSTTKVYEYSTEIKLVEENSIYFKNGFDSEKGISSENMTELCEYFTNLVKKYDLKYENTHIFVTGIFRELSKEKRMEYVKLFNDKFDLFFNIISHGIENYYLATAMQHDYNGKKVLIINMGGKTTELVTFENGKITKTNNLKVGVGDLLSKFDKVNDPASGHTIQELEDFVDGRLTDLQLDNDYDCAIFTGGEERFELLTDYKLIPNTLFDDGIHKYMIGLEEYMECTDRVFFDITMDELCALMPGNPKWMYGARPGAVLPVPIFRKANIKYIVPSDLNLINGVIKDNNY